LIFINKFYIINHTQVDLKGGVIMFDEIAKFLGKFDHDQKFVIYKVHKCHREQVYWMYPQEFLNVQGNIQVDELKPMSYTECGFKVRKGEALVIPEIDSNSHDGRHRVLFFYLNCKNHLLPVWIFGDYNSKDKLTTNIPHDVITEEFGDYIYFKIPTGL